MVTELSRVRACRAIALPCSARALRLFIERVPALEGAWQGNYGLA